MDSEADLPGRARMDGKSGSGDIAAPVFASSSGSEVEDVGGKRYLDFAAE
jgi:4-aminobutyrate aminotransferase-like enzyme